MTERFFVKAAALVLLTVSLFASAYAADSPFCNNRLIAGSYGFTIEGTKLAGAGPVGSQVGVAMTDFDGNGNLTQIDSVTIGGVTVADWTHTPAAGTYAVNPDCTGSFTINFTDGRPTVKVNFVVVENGSEIDTVVVFPAGVQGALATRSIGKRRFWF